MEQTAAVDRVIAVTAAVQTGPENRTVPSIVRRTSLKTVIEHRNDATAALQSSWKTTSAVMTFVDDDDDDDCLAFCHNTEYS
jgi:hypothetical protein